MPRTPGWCTTKGMRFYWTHPWEVPLSSLKARRFKWRLWRHGHLSPNYTRREARSGDGKAIPRRLRRAAQRQAFHMERVRHRCGDRPLPALSWYRSRRHNRAVGGARFSQHVKARACDIAEAVRQRLGAERFDRACQAVFKNGGIGTQSTFSGPVRHVDSRSGGPARWTY